MSQIVIVQNDENLTRVLDITSSYKITVLHKFPRKDSKVHMTYLDVTSPFRDYSTGEKIMIVTNRDLDRYSALKAGPNPINPSLSYMELGAGLGEFIPKLVEARSKFVGNLPGLPIVIDMANYELMALLIKKALNVVEKESSRERLETLLERCELMLDSQKVRLVNKPITEAAKMHSLKECADVLVDNFGPDWYWDTTNEVSLKSARQMQRYFLKKEGLFLPTNSKDALTDSDFRK